MNFIFKHRILALFSCASLVLTLAVFWPEPKKTGEIQKYYSIPQQQLLTIEYNGEMSLTEKGKVHVGYTITREESLLKPKEPVYLIEIKNLTTKDAKLSKRVAELSKLKRFYASALVRTIVQDWSELDFYYILKHEKERDTEYGLKDCANKLTVTFKSQKKQFCIGAASQGDTRRYLLDTERDKLLITPDFTIRRVLNSIFSQREQSIHPYGNEGADLIEIKIGSDQIKKYPTLREKTGGMLKLRMLIKDEGKKKVNVWYVDNLLTIKPSHAAELAQLLTALRVNAPFAMDTTTQLSDAIKQSGIDVKIQPGLTGSVQLKKTDQQNTMLTDFAFFLPGVKPKEQPAWQLENQIIRPLDSVFVSNFNTGFITAELYPRLMGIFVKFESDLVEAQKKGEQEKIEREKKEKNKVKNPP